MKFDQVPLEEFERREEVNLSKVKEALKDATEQLAFFEGRLEDAKEQDKDEEVKAVYREDVRDLKKEVDELIKKLSEVDQLLN